jgi:hypothetical protein
MRGGSGSSCGGRSSLRIWIEKGGGQRQLGRGKEVNLVETDGIVRALQSQESWLRCSRRASGRGLERGRRVARYVSWVSFVCRDHVTQPQGTRFFLWSSSNLSLQGREKGGGVKKGERRRREEEREDLHVQDTDIRSALLDDIAPSHCGNICPQLLSLPLLLVRVLRKFFGLELIPSDRARGVPNQQSHSIRETNHRTGDATA